MRKDDRNEPRESVPKVRGSPTDRLDGGQSWIRLNRYTMTDLRDFREQAVVDYYSIRASFRRNLVSSRSSIRANILRGGGRIPTSPGERENLQISARKTKSPGERQNLRAYAEKYVKAQT